MQIEIRAATPEDVTSIHSIYSASVLNDTASWELVPPDLDEMRTRVHSILHRGFPFLVAVALSRPEEAQAAEQVDGKVVGYSYASGFHARAGYRYTVENSIYVDAAHQRLGIGRRLLGTLIDICTQQGYRQMIAVIGGSERVASITLHQKLGFQQVGLLANIGLKNGRWLDCVYMQRALGVGNEAIPES